MCGCRNEPTAAAPVGVTAPLSVAALYPGVLDVPAPAQTLPGVEVIARPAFQWWKVVLVLAVVVVIRGGRA